jgi:predicted O-methyltransferase YrrM
MPQFSADWFSHVIPSWQRLFNLLGWTQDKPRSVVEIGCFEGRSTLWLLDNLLGHADSRIYCLDLFDRGVEHPPTDGRTVRQQFDSNIAESPHASKVEVLDGRSCQRLIELAHRGARADLVYVDGSHRAPDVLEDLVMSFHIAKIGAVIICDDYLWSNEPPGQFDLVNSPKLAIDSFVNCNIRRIQLLPMLPLYQIGFQKLSD